MDMERTYNMSIQNSTDSNLRSGSRDPGDSVLTFISVVTLPPFYVMSSIKINTTVFQYCLYISELVLQYILLRLMINNEVYTWTLISFFSFGFNEILIAISQMEIMGYREGVIWYPLTGLRAILQMRDCSYCY